MRTTADKVIQDELDPFQGKKLKLRTSVGPFYGTLVCFYVGEPKGEGVVLSLSEGEAEVFLPFRTIHGWSRDYV